MCLSVLEVRLRGDQQTYQWAVGDVKGEGEEEDEGEREREERKE